MKIHIWCIGRTKESYILEGLKILQLKTKRYWDLTWEEIDGIKYKSKDNPQLIQQAEEEIILKKLKARSTMILLDENGRQFDSVSLAKELHHLQDQQGLQELVFIIGGAYGFSEAIKQKAWDRWSLSALTFTHQMVRLILIEQLYRAGTILKGESYHH